MRKLQIVGRVGVAAIAIFYVIPLRQAYASDAITELNSQIAAIDKSIDKIIDSFDQSNNFIQLFTLNWEAGGLSAKLTWTVNQINAGTLVDPLYGTINALGANGNNTLSANAISVYDGIPVAVGASQLDSGGPHAFKWTLATGTVDLGVLTINGMQATASNALNISADTSVIVGSSGFDAIAGNLDLGQGGTTHAFRWTRATGMVDLGTLPTTGYGAFVTSIANGVNADGSVIVGESSYGNVATLYTHAFRWVLTPGTTTGTMTDIDGGAQTESDAIAVNADGSVVVGSADDGNGFIGTTHAFRWTQATGMVNIGRLPGLDTYASANAVSDDGNVIVGTSSHLGAIVLDQTAFRWTQSTGIQNLNTLLTNAGVNLNGAVLQTAVGITGDGQFIVGEGLFADG
jgi:probable HAF family extracellular repeat protein